jgi:hypothetical protein
MNDEKDRLGDKLRDKQRAEEDRYFAEQDRAKLEKLAKLGLCPRCGIPLVQRDYHGVSIDDCPRCHGIWLDKGELETVVDREDESWALRWLRDVLSGSHR